MFDFLTIRKTLNSFAKELTDVRFEIEKVLQEIENIQYAPAAKRDVIDALCVWASDNEAKYLEYFNSQILKLANNAEALREKEWVDDAFRNRGFLPDPMGVDRAITRDVQLCGLMGPTGFLAFVEHNMVRVNMPDGGIPLAERGPAIQKLEKKLADLRQREAALLMAADKSGLQVS